MTVAAYDATAMLTPSQPFLPPVQAITSVAPGRWGIAVSGGADSTALLRLAAANHRLSLHVIHLDHETRGQASAGDADFVRSLAASLELPATIAARAPLEASLPVGDIAALPHNPSARYRALRLALYRQTVERASLQGVLLAHHADDQAETVLLRLLRGGGYQTLTGMAETSLVAGVLLRRPLLQTRRSALRDYLGQIGQSWREDASNAGSDYARNRVRAAIAGREAVVLQLQAVAERCRLLAAWVDQQSPTLADSFAASALANLPTVLARAAAANWLLRHNVPSDQISPAQVDSIILLCRDAAMPPRLTLPTGIMVSRRQGMVHVRR